MLVGGAPLNEEFGKAVGADAYCRDAAVAAETAKALVIGPPRQRPNLPARPSDPVRSRAHSSDGTLSQVSR